MSVCELTADQMIILKQNHLMERLDREENRSPSWGELADADELVSDEEILDEYGSVMFVEDDFG